MSEEFVIVDDEIEMLAAKLSASTSLAGVQIMPGVANLAKVTAPRRIVLYPDEGTYEDPTDQRASICDVKLRCIASIWGGSEREARYIRKLLFRSLDEPGAVDWKFDTEKHNTGPDTTINGAHLDVYFRFQISIDRLPNGVGLVESVGLTRVQKLALELGAADTQAYISGSTYGLPASGLLSIDNEKLSYSAKTGDSFVGLTRGLSGTTAAVHAIGAAVHVTTSP